MEMLEIQHYCTVRENELTTTPEGKLCCTRCTRNLVNLDDPAAVEEARSKGTLHCGYIRRLAIPALASSLALSSCADNPSSRQVLPGMIPPASTSKVSENLIAGGIAPNDEPKPELPTAKPVPGRAGIVYSPYTGKEVDIDGIPSGKKVIDPTTGAEKKLFLVPPPEWSGTSKSQE